MAAQRSAELDADRRARVEQTRLHARALRQLMRFLRPGGTAARRRRHAVYRRGRAMTAPLDKRNRRMEDAARLAAERGPEAPRRSGADRSRRGSARSACSDGRSSRRSSSASSSAAGSTGPSRPAFSSPLRSSCSGPRRASGPRGDGCTGNERRRARRRLRRGRRPRGGAFRLAVVERRPHARRAGRVSASPSRPALRSCWRSALVADRAARRRAARSPRRSGCSRRARFSCAATGGSREVAAEPRAAVPDRPGRRSPSRSSSPGRSSRCSRALGAGDAAPEPHAVEDPGDAGTPRLDHRQPDPRHDADATRRRSAR